MVEIRRQYAVGNDRSLEGLVGVLLVAGVVLLALNGPFTSVRDLRIVNFVLFTLPVAIAVVCYVRVVPTTSVLEVGALTLWAYFAIRTSGVFGYFLFGSRSVSHAGELSELQNNVTLFCLLVAVTAGLYAVAATQRDRRVPRWGAIAVVPVGQLLAYGVYVLA